MKYVYKSRKMDLATVWCHDNLTLEARWDTFDWLIRVATGERKGPRVSIVCVRFALGVVDRYVHAVGLHSSHLDLRFVAIAALFVSAKMFSPKYPDPSDYAEVVKLSVEELLVMEMEVLQVLGYQLYENDAHWSVLRYLKSVDEPLSLTQINAIVYFAEIAMLDWRLHRVPLCDLVVATKVFLGGPLVGVGHVLVEQMVAALVDEKRHGKRRRTAIHQRHLGKLHMLNAVDAQLEAWMTHFAKATQKKKRARDDGDPPPAAEVKRSKFIEVQLTIVPKRCQGKTVKGKQCKRVARHKTDFCRVHTPSIQ